MLDLWAGNGDEKFDAEECIPVSKNEPADMWRHWGLLLVLVNIDAELFGILQG